ncbi:redoxin domain-containing protein [Natronomonas sp. EA1]|uniref:redoxin domain-containing protein n=1 Tax=Natronomonas sp. EA1 TaxID=3421655 RepID=UPI003EBA1889
MAETVGLEVGDRAPAFTAPLVRPNGDVSDVPLEELLEDGPVLLAFYTADFSPDCVDEWCAFRDFDWFAATDDVQVVGISKSGTRSHKQFIKRLSLQFPMYSDEDLSVAEAFDVKYKVFGLVERSRRSCFLIDTDRTIRYRWIGEHWLDPTRSVPPVDEIHEKLVEILDADAATGAF